MTLRAKYVYIDIWATWCMPCLAELEQMCHDNPNTVFTGISTDKDREAWVKMVKGRNLGGVQLGLDENYPDVRPEYDLSGIPRFILIDKEGSIINFRASGPSS